MLIVIQSKKKVYCTAKYIIIIKYQKMVRRQQCDRLQFAVDLQIVELKKKAMNKQNTVRVSVIYLAFFEKFMKLLDINC